MRGDQDFPKPVSELLILSYESAVLPDVLALSFQATQSEDLSCFFSAPSYTGYWFCFRVFILLFFSCSVLFLTVRPGQAQSPVALICGTRMQVHVLPHPAWFYALQWSTQLQEQTSNRAIWDQAVCFPPYLFPF